MKIKGIWRISGKNKLPEGERGGKGRETNGDIVDNEIENDIIPPSTIYVPPEWSSSAKRGGKGGEIKRKEAEVQEEEEEGCPCFFVVSQLAGEKLPSPRGVLTI